jgi:hypothetical protein
MKKPMWLYGALLAAAGCDGQQYVDPGTVRLLITDQSTSVARVNRCNFVPVLLGSEVKSSYVVEGDLSATLTVTRDSVTLEFEGAAEPQDPFVIETKDLQQSGTSADNAPRGYSVELSSGCTPDDN